MSKIPLKILVAAAAILGMSSAATLAATDDEKLAQAPAAQSAPAAERSTAGQASPAEDKTPAADKTGATAEKPATTAEKSVAEKTARKAGAARASARPARMVHRNAYRIVETASYDRASRGGCFFWCVHPLYIGIAY